MIPPTASFFLCGVPTGDFSADTPQGLGGTPGSEVVDLGFGDALESALTDGEETPVPNETTTVQDALFALMAGLANPPVAVPTGDAQTLDGQGLVSTMPSPSPESGRVSDPWLPGGWKLQQSNLALTVFAAPGAPTVAQQVGLVTPHSIPGENSSVLALLAGVEGRLPTEASSVLSPREHLGSANPHSLRFSGEGAALLGELRHHFDDVKIELSNEGLGEPTHSQSHVSLFAPAPWETVRVGEPGRLHELQAHLVRLLQQEDSRGATSPAMGLLTARATLSPRLTESVIPPDSPRSAMDPTVSATPPFMDPGATLQTREASSLTDRNDTGSAESAVNLPGGRELAVQSSGASKKDSGESSSGKDDERSSPLGEDVGSLSGPGSAPTAARLETASPAVSSTTVDSQKAMAANLARTAATRAEDLSDRLRAQGGGTARIQIKDARLGQVGLHIQMGADNRVHIRIDAENDLVREELTRNIEKLKKSLEDRRLSVGDLSVGGVEAVAASQDSSAARQDSSQQNSSRNPSPGDHFLPGDGRNGRQDARDGQRENARRDEFLAASGWAGSRGGIAAAGTRQKSSQRPFSAAPIRQENGEPNANSSLKVTA